MQFPVISLGTLYILTTLLVTRCALANPIKESRQLVLPENFCRPNFEGAGVTIGNSAEEWGTYPASVAGAHVNNRSHRPSVFGYADFRLEQDGQYPSRYIIKDVDHSHLVVSVRNHKLLLVDQHVNDESQLWDVTCDWCATNISQLSPDAAHAAAGCNITWVPNGYCVTTDRVALHPLFLEPCRGIDAQNFDFWRPTL